MDKEKIEPWTINIDMGDWSPRKATPEELAKNHAEHYDALNVVEVLTKINKLLAKNKLELYQSEGDGDSGYTPSISIGNHTTEIDNETGLFTLPKVPEKWDEGTIVRKRLPQCSIGSLMYISATI